MITVGSLCTGYGGLDLGLEMGLDALVTHAWHVEYDKHPSAILAHRFPGVPNYGDVKLAPWADMEPVDWLTAGYPCQPFSNAGHRKGADDPRHLWPGVARAIGVLRPRHVLLENVAAHLGLGFDVVLGDLAGMGYDATWGVVRASEAGAPHSRARIFVVATDASHDGQQWSWGARDGRAGSPHGDLAVTDTYRAGLGGLAQLHRDAPTGIDGAHRGHPDGRGDGTDWRAYTGAIRRWEAITGRAAPYPTEPAHRGDGERLSAVFVEWLMGLPAGWVTDVDLPRSAKLKALGNGVVPQQAALAVRTLLGLPSAAEVAA